MPQRDAEQCPRARIVDAERHRLAAMRFGGGCVAALATLRARRGAPRSPARLFRSCRHRGRQRARRRARRAAIAARHDVGPVAGRGLAKQSRGRVPRAVRTTRVPAPVGANGEHYPSGPRERASKMRDARVDADDEIELRDKRRRAIEIVARGKPLQRVCAAHRSRCRSPSTLPLQREPDDIRKREERRELVSGMIARRRSLALRRLPDQARPTLSAPAWRSSARGDLRAARRHPRRGRGRSQESSPRVTPRCAASAISGTCASYAGSASSGTVRGSDARGAREQPDERLRRADQHARAARGERLGEDG